MNVRNLNQDNVLDMQDDSELSPSEFDSIKENTGSDGGSKKNKSWVPLLGGIFIAIGIIGFFGWKIAAPYFSHSNSSVNANAFTPIAAPKPFGNSNDDAGIARPDQPGSQTSGGYQGATLPEIYPAPPGGNPASGVPTPQSMDRTGAAATATGQALNDPLHSGKMGPSEKTTSGVGANDVVLINKRIDELATSLSELKDVVAKMQQQLSTAPVSHAAPVQTKKTVSTAAAPSAPKHKPFVVVKKPSSPIAAVKDANVEKPQTQEPAAAGMQLQAVLQDRAWFKTSTGVTITVSPGEELKGVGVVQQIDAETGRVIFTNGQVFR